MRTGVSTVAIDPKLASPTYAFMAVRCATTALSSTELHVSAKVVAACHAADGPLGLAVHVGLRKPVRLPECPRLLVLKNAVTKQA